MKPNINTFKVEMLESLKENVDVLAQNLKFSQNIIENLIRDEFRSSGVAVDLDRMQTVKAEKEVKEIEAKKEELPQIAAPVAQSEPAPVADEHAVAETPAEEKKADQVESLPTGEANKTE